MESPSRILSSGKFAINPPVHPELVFDANAKISSICVTGASGATVDGCPLRLLADGGHLVMDDHEASVLPDSWFFEASEILQSMGHTLSGDISFSTPGGGTRGMVSASAKASATEIFARLDSFLPDVPAALVEQPLQSEPKGPGFFSKMRSLVSSKIASLSTSCASKPSKRRSP